MNIIEKRILNALSSAGQALAIGRIAQACTMRRSIALVSTLHALGLKNYVARSLDGSVALFSITAAGTRALDELRDGRKNSRAKRHGADNAQAAPEITQTVELVKFPRDQLRALATAALASTVPLDENLRAACARAIQEAA